MEGIGLLSSWSSRSSEGAGTADLKLFFIPEHVLSTPIRMAELDSLAMGGFSHQNRREQLERRQEELRAAQERQRQATSRPELRDLPTRIAQAQREIGDLRLRLNGLKAERER